MTAGVRVVPVIVAAALAVAGADVVTGAATAGLIAATTVAKGPAGLAAQAQARQTGPADLGAQRALAAQPAQTTQAARAAMPADVRARVQHEPFQAVTSVRGLPLGVRDALQALFGGLSLDIADPGARFQTGRAVTDPTLPVRRLVAAGCSYEYCLVYYERAGTAPSWRVALFRWTPNASRFEWGGRAPGGLTAFDDVRARLLSATLPGGSPDPW